MTDRIVYFLQVLIQLLFRVFLRVHVQGLENIPRTGPAIIASNHVTALDPFLIGSLMPRVCQYMAKKELFENYFSRKLFGFLQAIPIDRHGQSLKGIRAIKKVLDAGRPVLLFPEGTRSQSGEIGAPKVGVGMLASMTSAIIIPTCIIGLQNAKISFLKRPRVIVSFGKPIDPATFMQGGKRKKELYYRISEEVRHRLVSLSNAQRAMREQGEPVPS